MRLKNDISHLPMCLSLGHLYVVEGLWTENLPPADLSLRCWQIYYDKKWPRVDDDSEWLFLVCFFCFTFYNSWGWAQGMWGHVLDCAGKFSPPLNPWGGPFRGSPSRIAGFISQMFGCEIWIEKPLDSITLQSLAYSSPRVKIHFIIELDFSHRL